MPLFFRPYCLTLALLGFGLPALSESIASAPELKYLMIIGQSRPLQMLDSQGRPSGLISDLITELSRDRHPLTPVRLPYKRLIHEVKAGRHKNWIAYGAKAWDSPMAKSTVDCAVHQAKHSLITLSDAPSVQTLEDLRHGTVIMMNGFTFKQLEPEIATGNIGQLRVNNYRAAFKSVQIGRGLGFLEMDFRIRYNRMANKFNPEDFHIQDATGIIPPYTIYLALDPAIPEPYRQQLIEHCQKLQANGFIEQLHRKYSPQ